MSRALTMFAVLLLALLAFVHSEPAGR